MYSNPHNTIVHPVMTMVNRGTYVFAESDAAPANIPSVFNSQYLKVYDVGQTMNLCNYVSSPDSFHTPSTHTPKIDRGGEETIYEYTQS